MKVVDLLRLPLLLTGLCLISSAQGPPEPYQVLNGNWYLILGPELSEYSSVALSVGVEGNKIYGEGSLSINCQNDKMNGNFFVEGEIASDRSFVLRNVGVLPELSPDETPDAIHITGKLPAAGSTEWSGRFAGTQIGKNRSCSPASGDFIAKQFPALKGVFSGIVRERNGSEAEVSIEMSQGSLFSTGIPLPFGSRFIPLSATMSICGASNFPSGKFTTPNTASTGYSRIDGRQFSLSFATTDGCTLRAFGTLSDFPSINRIDLSLHYVCFRDVDPHTIAGHGRLNRQ